MIIAVVILSLIIPFTYILIGLFSWYKPPKNINGFYGYRTSRATTNQETWVFANKLSGKLFLTLGVILTPISLIVGIILTQFNEDTAGFGLLLMICIQSIAIAFIIKKTEQELKKKF